MGYVPGFVSDLFISYSHVDNDPLLEGKAGWVDFFEDLLLKRVRVRLGAEITVFRDPQLRQFGKFSDQLAEKLSSSATFLCVLSPRYLDSEWCAHELSQFYRQAGSGRIIKVAKTAVDEESAREEIRPLLAEIREVLETRFYEKEQSGLLKDLQPEVIPADIPACLEKIDTIAQNLVELLKSLRNAPPNNQASKSDPAAPLSTSITGPGAVAPNQIAVYLAETTKDLVEDRNRIKTELLQFNYRVFPEQPLPQDAESLVSTVRNYMLQAKLSVHLIGAGYGARPESEDRSIPHIQYDVAADLSRENGLIQVAWMPDGLEPKEESQNRFLTQVKNSSTEFLRAKLEDVKTEILKKLKPDTPDGWEDDGTENPINVCLFCHEKDVKSVGPLYSHMTVNELFKVKLPLKDAESFQRHKQLLQASDAVLLYYGTGDEDWFANIWRLIQRHVSAGRTKPVLAKAIYAGDPSTMEKDLLESKDLVIIKNYGQFTAQSLSPFIQKIREAKGAN